MDKEAIYDEQIAPLLLAAGTIARDNGIDLLACVDISSDSDRYAVAETRCIDLQNAQAAMRLVQFAIVARGNVDNLIISLARDQEGKPHSSLFLKMLEAETTRTIYSLDEAKGD